GEILAGAALASLLARRSLPEGLARLAPPCLAAIVALCVVTPAGKGWAYSGGLPLFALVSAGLIAGLQVDGPVRSLLAWRPLVGLGVISYGVYLFHWPVFVVLDEQRTGMDGWALGLLRLAVTLAVALTVYLILEQPVRARVLLARPSRFVMSAGTAVAVVAVAVTVTVPDLGTHGGSRPALLAASQPPAAGKIAAPPAPKTVAVIGDSVPDWLLRDAAPSYRRSDFVVVNDAHEGCDGAVDEPMAQGAHGEELQRGPQCQAWPDSYPALVADPGHAVDIALLIVGQAPVLSHLIDGRWVHPCEDMQWYSSDVTARIQFLKQHVPSVFVVLPSWADNSISLYVPSDHEARYACVRDQLELVARQSGVPTIDLADVLCPGGPEHVCLDYRQRDGLHVDPNRASLVLNWMLDQLPGASPASGLAHVS
ncbi:MAG: hypothetical protein QOG30_764, partial [Acidimicrobiaceae bacterium]